MVIKFWHWYKENLFFNQILVAVLFGWQLLHLYWLTTYVVADRILGFPIFNPNDLYQFLLISADYFEIPALISGTLLYLHSLREDTLKKNIIFILLINSQWLHLFWITDEFVLDKFHHTDDSTILPVWLAWTAVTVDYFELPVIYDTIKKTILSFKLKFTTSSNRDIIL
ncbi:MAG: hypothetical protein Q8Q89_05050 [bacterium]|nr:hypothetical protein [bacterium]